MSNHNVSKVCTNNVREIALMFEALALSQKIPFNVKTHKHVVAQQPRASTECCKDDEVFVDINSGSVENQANGANFETGEIHSSHSNVQIHQPIDIRQHSIDENQEDGANFETEIHSSHSNVQIYQPIDIRQHSSDENQGDDANFETGEIHSSHSDVQIHQAIDIRQQFNEENSENQISSVTRALEARASIQVPTDITLNQIDDIPHLSDIIPSPTIELLPEADDIRLPECKVPYIIDELLTKEQNYIDELNRGIRIFMSAFDEPAKTHPLPVSLLGQKMHLFGDIERIRNFHANIFLPSLQQHDPTDVSGICETFCRHCTAHSFYTYVLYAINSRRREQMAARHSEFFDKRRVAHGDRLGLTSILVKPIQRLANYQTMLAELIKELAKRLNRTGVKEQIASCCRAEKHLKRLLEQVNDSRRINDIVDNRSINVMHQGMFRLLDQFEVYDYATRRRYAGVLFLFDKGVLLTESLDADRLRYRGFITLSRLGTHRLLDPNSFALMDERRHVRLVELASERKLTVMWLAALADLEQSRERIFGRRSTLLWRDSGISDRDSMSCGTLQTFVVLRNFIDREAQNRNAVNVGSVACSSVASGDFPTIGSVLDDVADAINPTSSFYVVQHRHNLPNVKKFQHLYNAEKHFIQILSNYKHLYLDALSEEESDALRNYRLAVQILLDFHRHIHYPKLLNSKHNIEAVCEIFRTALAHHSYLEAHQMYAATCTQAYSMLKSMNFVSELELEYCQNLPLEHLDRTNAFLFNLMYALKDAEETYVTSDFKAVASLHVELHRFVEGVRDNLKLNSMVNDAELGKNYGFVERWEPCLLNGYKMRLLLMTKGLICVRTRLSKKTQREKFMAIEFQIPLSSVRIIDSNRCNNRLQIYASCTREVVVFNVVFPTVAAKETVLKRLKGI